MPKATLTFELPEESWAYRQAIHGARYSSTIREVDEFLRMGIKHGFVSGYNTYKEGSIDGPERRAPIHMTINQLAEYIRNMILDDVNLMEEEL